MDQHTDLFVSFIFRAIMNNIEEKVKDTHPYYNQIRTGGKLLWRDYFKHVKTNKEALSHCVARLKKDLDTLPMKNIREYIIEFGCPMID